MNKAILYRIYPNDKQTSLFLQTFGCCRKIWNLMMDTRETEYKKTGKTVKPTPAQYKDDFPYLKKVDSLALANVQLNQEQAYNSYFKGDHNRPKYRSKKKDRRSYTTNCVSGSIRFSGDRKKIRLPKAGWVKIEQHRNPDPSWILKSATISMEADGSFYCSVLFDFEDTVNPISNPEYNAIGLDYKNNGLFVSSDGEVCGSPRFMKKSQKKLARKQRKLNKKVTGSNSYKKEKKKIGKLHLHVRNQRKDFLHKKSTEIANRYDMVCVESLDLIKLSKPIRSKKKGVKLKPGRVVMDNGYGIFFNLLDYKLRERGGVLVKIDKWYASSQTCSCCGHKNPELKDPSIKEWECPICGTYHDRDINAAINIKREGIRQFCSD